MKCAQGGSPRAPQASAIVSGYRRCAWRCEGERRKRPRAVGRVVDTTVGLEEVVPRDATLGNERFRVRSGGTKSAAAVFSVLDRRQIKSCLVASTDFGVTPIRTFGQRPAVRVVLGLMHHGHDRRGDLQREREGGRRKSRHGNEISFDKATHQWMFQSYHPAYRRSTQPKPDIKKVDMDYRAVQSSFMTRRRPLRTICAVAVVLGVLSASAHGLAHGHHEQETAAECTICLTAESASHAIGDQPLIVSDSLPLIGRADSPSAIRPRHISRPEPTTRGPPASL